MSDAIAGAVGGLLYRPPWFMNVYPDAGEAGGGYSVTPKVKPQRVKGGMAADPTRSRAESVARSVRRLRRYCAANRLTVMGTLTYAGAGVHEPAVIREDLGTFFRQLRISLGGEPFPYAWVPEWHKTDHGLHAHFGVHRRIPVGLIRKVWGHGHIFMTQHTGRATGGGLLHEARHAARYLSKYVGKDFDTDRQSELWQHRYDVGQGFEPRIVRVEGWSRDEVVGSAISVMGGEAPASSWSSDEAEDWPGAPRMVMRWD